MSRRLPGSIVGASVALVLVASSPLASAEVPVQRTFFRLPSSNGHGAVILDLSERRLTHFREHLFATEEPLLDGAGDEVWSGNQPQVVRSRDLLYDAYFGVRVAGAQRWLTSVPADLDASGYAGWQLGKRGGTGVATLVQRLDESGLEATQYFFAPRSMPRAAYVMAMRIANTGVATATGVSAFSIHNFHLGFGRPGVMVDLGEQGETVSYDPSGPDFLERAFAGVAVTRALGAPAHHGVSSAASAPAQNVFSIVDSGGTTDLPDSSGGMASDGSVSAYQWTLGDLAPGEEAWVGVAVAHHGDPFAGATVQGWLDAYVDGLSPGEPARAAVEGEILAWASFQTTLDVPATDGEGEESLLRQSAVMLAMGQVAEERAYLREHLSFDGEPRHTRFEGSLPGEVEHRGKGAVIASLPPGEWTYAWIRDGAYAAAAMATLGMHGEAREALSFYLRAEGGRFQHWSELAPYAMPAYLISLTRYHGFGVEETDFNDFGPNLELDGFGLFLWALREYEVRSGDPSLVDESWATVSTLVADALVALRDPGNGLIRRDSSIWETHWNGRERSWAYTSITAARGLCDAAALAERVGDSARADTYREAGIALRAAIAARLTDGAGALASNAEELASGQGYFDAAVLDAIAFGLFDPRGRIATATLAGLDRHLVAPAGAGWSRNDDRFDHGGAEDVSPWGSEYDSAEWVITDLRGAIATRMAGDTERSDRLLAWVRDQSVANYLAVAETYDEGTGAYKFNAPMLGFGAGAYALALAHRGGEDVEPACGGYFDEAGGAGGSGGDGGSSSTSPSTAASGFGGSVGGSSAGEGDGCDCGAAGTRGRSGHGLGVAALLALAGMARRWMRRVLGRRMTAVGSRAGALIRAPVRAALAHHGTGPKAAKHA